MDTLSLFHPLVRRFSPVKLVKTETVNGEPAVESPYQAPLREFGFKRDYKALVLRRQYSSRPHFSLAQQ